MVLTQRSQKIFVIVFALCILVLAGVTAIFAPAIINAITHKNGAYKNITFTDANLACEEKTKAKFGDKIRTLATDNHSSFFDNKTGIYKIFLNVDVRGRKGKIESHYINCFVRPSNGKINRFEVLNGGAGKSSKDSGTNFFGMPIK